MAAVVGLLDCSPLVVDTSYTIPRQLSFDGLVCVYPFSLTVKGASEEEGGLGAGIIQGVDKLGGVYMPTWSVPKSRRK